MAGDKKVVIKINLPTSDKKNTRAGSGVREVTEWNMGRLVTVGLILLLVLIGLLYVFLGSDSDQDESLTANNNEITINSSKLTSISDVDKNKENRTNVIVEKLDTDSDLDKNKTNKSIPALIKPTESSQVNASKAKVEEKQKTHPLVVRAQLARNVINKEPAGEVAIPFVVDRNKARALFYFTELKNMKGKAVYHQWTYNGKSVFKRKINIRGNRWRASTRKMINPNNVGKWSVRLLDQKGRVMNEIVFTVVLSDS